MKCVILAAGEGKRMHPLTYTRSKVMIPIAGKPLLEWNLTNAIQAGITEFIFIVGYRDDMVRSYFGDGSAWDVTIDYVNQGKPRGTAHAIGMVESFVNDFLVLSGDTIFGVSDIQQSMQQKHSIGLYEVNHPERYGVVEQKGEKIKRIVEKTLNPPSNLINAGIYHFSSSIFDYIKNTPHSKRGEYEITDSINQLTQKEPLTGFLLTYWRDVVYPWDLFMANSEMMKQHSYEINGTVEQPVTIKGDVHIGKGTIIKSGSYIEGPVIIGKNCKIGPNCYIRPDTTIGNDCHIGNACEIKNSIFFDNSNAPHQNYVGDSIIGSNCNLGAGTKIANLRLDKQNIHTNLNGKSINTGLRKLGAIMGDNVQTGINAMIDVGALIGNDVFIGPGALVKGEIQNNTHFY
jgi:bifunctional UDP-N-acetylglucosamine pyrophosphorylase/glucosamine-1-phosphate N-acetyltransferase